MLYIIFMATVSIIMIIIVIVIINYPVFLVLAMCLMDPLTFHSLFSVQLEEMAWSKDLFLAIGQCVCHDCLLPEEGLQAKTLQQQVTNLEQREYRISSNTSRPRIEAALE